MGQKPVSPEVADTNLHSSRLKETLWPYYTATLIYIIFGVVVLVDRRAEIGNLFEPPAQASGLLPLNSIGDVLAGFFAPLAFLWLFAATQLQRVELRLQREELADTRAVLNDQRLELERAAKESNEQTHIMRRTLEASQSKEMYDLFGLDLYYLARRCIRYNDRMLFSYKENIGGAARRHYSYLYGVTPEFSVSQKDPSTVDTFYESFKSMFEDLDKRYSDIRIDVDTEDFDIRMKELNYVADMIRSIEYTAKNTDNDLVKSRFKDLELDKLSLRLRHLIDSSSI